MIVHAELLVKGTCLFGSGRLLTILHTLCGTTSVCCVLVVFVCVSFIVFVSMF